MLNTDHSPLPNSVDGVIDEAVTAAKAGDQERDVRAHSIREHAGDGHRPLYHLWKDGESVLAPNALVRIGEEYHLFPQLDGCWGHAVSTDLVHWTDLAEDPEQRLAAGPGTVVVDRYDVSGLFGGRSGMVALFTSPDPADAGIRMALSTDRGAHWQIRDGVVLASPDGRERFVDPMVIHDLDHHQWVMVVTCGELVEFFSSEDLVHWRPSAGHGRNYFGAGPWHEGGEFRHPQLFPMRVQATNVTRWVLGWSSASSPTTNGSATRYVVGDWDGCTFTPLTDPSPVLRTDVGRDFFAATTCDDGERRVMIARMSNEDYARQTPTDGWSGPLTTPREIGLVSTREGLRLTQRPVDEVSSLHLSTRSVEDTPVGTEFNPIGNLGGRALDIEAELEVSSFYGAHAVTIEVCCGGDRHTDIVWRPAERTLTVDRSQSGATEFSESFATPSQTRDVPTESVVRADSSAVAVTWPESTLGGVRRVWMRILIDACSIEVFSADGLASITTAVFPGTGATGLRLSAESGAARIISVRASTMERVSQGRA
ncbi:Levanase [Acidipropionibacterium acidipropionici ATCC 4875]|uniref:Levanase n=1 Tax=Acidipropionibacterium acidipropionici (strain ATCC 4875 / DSM 20272 / JCM 6432 / NBRC 12425 / NCIMB 8070 / 4) TaxID=1171373 RepID=K7RWW7_ACIA4|nr:glycoside hydrolase family 32 protein [Acidipropionibacterium acidipropionici]AFV90916.1 Levanase [Acidipropionibacterium acidipropionici ATCC 4875]ALN14971.1 hypothetical protein ASQ49_06395 [Acidipropionibacterium acidipropionici]APZ09278.1 hypothetical protein BWX38_08535 [Acidipropionibacterium acidipropionici]